MAISHPKAPRARIARRNDPDANLPEVIELSPEEAWEEYARSAREQLGVAPAEFEKRWARGEYEDPAVHSKAVEIWMIRVSQPRV